MDNNELRELLELAAKAVGLKDAVWDDYYGAISHTAANGIEDCPWNPATSNDESRRLEVALGIQVTPYPIYAEPKHAVLARKCRLGKEDNGIGEPDTCSIEWLELYGDDPEAATRLAVLRCAAEIGRAMP